MARHPDVVGQDVLPSPWPEPLAEVDDWLGRYRSRWEQRLPPQMIGGYVTGPVLIARSDQFVLAARQVLAFPVGVEVELEAHGRGTFPGTTAPRDPEGLTDHRQLRFQVQFADGRKAAQDDEAGLRSGLGPMLIINGFEGSSGGPDGREEVRLTLWLWPLPPPGPVTITCSWPGFGLQNAGLVIDGGSMRVAASQAQPFWPAPDS